MKKRECKVGMECGFKSDTERYGKVIKIKDVVAVVEVWDGETGDTINYEISFDRLWSE